MKPKKILLLDNNDSFTSILCHEMNASGGETDIILIDQFNDSLIPHYDGLLISPGPGLPKDNQLPELIRRNEGRIAVLGICLGMQAIAEAYGGALKNFDQVYHGQSRKISHNEEGIFNDIPNPMSVGLYHSWFVDRLGSTLQQTAISENGIIMALKHPNFKIQGVQFHPESYITQHGRKLLSNWLESIR